MSIEIPNKSQIVDWNQDKKIVVPRSPILRRIVEDAIGVTAARFGRESSQDIGLDQISQDDNALRGFYWQVMAPNLITAHVLRRPEPQTSHFRFTRAMTIQLAADAGIAAASLAAALYGAEHSGSIDPLHAAIISGATVKLGLNAASSVFHRGMERIRPR